VVMGVPPSIIASHAPAVPVACVAVFALDHQSAAVPMQVER